MNSGIGGTCLNKDTLFCCALLPLPFPLYPLIVWIFLKDIDNFVLLSCFQAFRQRAKDND